MATQQKASELEFPSTLSGGINGINGINDIMIEQDPPTLSLSDHLDFSSDYSGLTRVMKLDLLTLPQFNVTYIARCLTVKERLKILCNIHHRFRNFVLQPQCFPDMSFFPIRDSEQYAPTILSTNGDYGITYVEINIFSKHPFIQRVALLAGMWNFKCDLWHNIDWPSNINIESLQLTLDFNYSHNEINLESPPKLIEINNNNNNNNHKEDDE